MRVTFLGLGVMGYPMAGHLTEAGHQVTVYNRTRQKALDWCEQYPGDLATVPAQAVQGADFIFSCVGNDDDLREVTLGQEGAFQGIKSGAVFVDHTTTSAKIARELNELALQAGFGYLDAPVSGGQPGAEAGKLTIMVGGDEACFKTAGPVMGCYAKVLKLMGPSGSGQLTKMVNQICVAGLLQGLAEGLNFARRVGLDGEAVVDAISRGAAQSWQMENRYQAMLGGDFDFGFAVDWMRKDLDIAMEEAGAHGVAIPVTELVDSFYAEVQAMGGGRWDTSSLITRLG